MKKKIVLFTLLAGVMSYGLSSYHAGPALNGYDCTGAESACSGSYANFTGCSNGGCHGGATATSTISCVIALDSAGGVPTTQYVAGMTYTVTITGNNTSGDGNAYYGFQLTSIKGAASAATVSNAGTWATTGLPATTHIAPPTSYTYLNICEQSSKIAVTGTTITESFVWTAPVAGTGTISFWGAANFVNGDGSADRQDIWNTGSLVVTEEAPLGVATVVNTADVTVYPNPMTDLLNVAFNAAEGNNGVTVYDLNGNLIATQAVTAGSNVATFATASWANGMYYVSVSNNGQVLKTISVVKK